MRFLSDEWLGAADEALRDMPPVDGTVVVGFEVIDGPGGDSAHRLILGPPPVGARRGTGDASLTLVMNWQLAVAVAQGEVSAQRAFLDGRLQLRGDPSVLLGYQEQLAAVDDRLASLRARTTFA